MPELVYVIRTQLKMRNCTEIKYEERYVILCLFTQELKMAWIWRRSI